jgi:uncharacterized protein (DUF1800 family)
MEKRKVDCSGTRLIRLIGVCLIIFAASILGMAQTIPDAPVLISKDDSTRAYAIDANRWNGRINKPIESIKQGRSVMMFLTNVKDLLPGEGANAFRSYAEDGSKRGYIFRVETFEPVKGMDWVYAVRVTLDPDMEDVGDVLVRITWRGMTTNRVRLGVGYAGDGPPNDEGSVPTPMPWERPSTSKGSGQTEAVTPINYPDLMRFMQQATYGPSPALEQRLRRIGIHVWLNEQFNMPLPTNDVNPSCDPTTGICTILPDVYPNLPLQPINQPTTCTGDCRRNNYSQYPMQRWFFTNALYGQDQLRRRVAWALLQILVVSGVDLQQPSWVLHYQKLLDRNAFGNYRTMLKDVTLSPAMGNYLDMMLSTRFNYNENFAREINQLFAVGLFEMNLDGTFKLDANNQLIPTYSQATIDNFTKVFTGWQLCASCPNAPPAGTPNYIDPMFLNQNLHDVTSKTLYNYPGAPFPTIAAGQNGNVEIEQALDNIYNHPNVAPFVTKNLIQHLVTSDPSPAYVQRIATVFNTYRTDANQMRYVIYAILTDPEARGNIKNDPRYGLLREPVLLAANTLRQFGAKAFTSTGCDLATPSTCSDGAVNDFSQIMGQNVYLAPTVFNYYPPDYIVPNTNPLVLGPEFAIYTTSTAFQRANFVNQFVMGTGYANTTGTNTNRPFGTSISLAELQAASAADATGNQLLNLVNSKLMHGTMSPQMRSTILTAVTTVASTNNMLRAQTAAYLVLTSSQYQVQK